MPQIMDMFSQMQSGQNPMKPSQTPTTLQPMAAEPAARAMSPMAGMVQQQMMPGAQ